MWPEIFEFAAIALSVICCAAAVKLADDYLDSDLDRHSAQFNWANVLGPGVMLYAMLFIVFAASINAPVSMSLFLGSYIIGMFQGMKERYPSRLNGFQESVLVFILGTIFWGWKLMLFAVMFVLSVQLIDDCIDIHIDGLAGYRNLAYRFGVLECMLLALLMLLLSWWIYQPIFLPVFCGTAFFYMIMQLYLRRCRHGT
ncbi:MAG TPA: hypothetical protein VGL27_12475 [Negativicutes bacterium]